MLRKFDDYVAQLNNAERAGTKNNQVNLVDCVDQAWLIDCLFESSIKRSDGRTLSLLKEVTDVDIRNLYVRPLAPGERPPAVDCATISTTVKWPSETDTLSAVNASGTYKQRMVRAFREAGHLCFLQDERWDEISHEWIPSDYHTLTRLLTSNIKCAKLRDCIEKDIKQHRIRSKLFSSWHRLLEDNARMVTLGKPQNFGGHTLGGGAGLSNRRDRGNKRQHTDYKSIDPKTRRDIIQECKNKSKLKPNDIATVRYIFPTCNDANPPYCTLRDNCEGTKHWLVGPHCCPQPKAEARMKRCRSILQRSIDRALEKVNLLNSGQGGKKST